MNKMKKIKTSYGTIIPFLLIVNTILMPLSFIPKKVEAQSVAGYTSGLAPAIAKLPQCGGTALGAIKGLFSGIGSLFSSSDNSYVPSLGEAGYAPTPVTDEGINATLEDTASSAKNSATNNPVSDPTTHDLLGKIVVSSAKNAEADKANSDNATCIASIGRLIIKMLLQKLTVSTVNWIRSGFNGGPAFVQNPSKFFGDIAKNEVLQFGLEINNPQLFPFGKAWMQNTAVAFNNKFQDNAQYSLNKLISATNPDCGTTKDGYKIGCDTAFSQDFSQGGWNAWTAMTQVPANNPLGFQLMADNELQQRLAGTVQSTAQATHEALQAANGFLGDERCIDDPNVTKTQEAAALKETPSRELCPGGWEYVTPGSMVAYAAQNVMGYQSTSYFNVQDLNDAVAAISDALLSQFSSTIMEKGFANTSGVGANGTLYTSSEVGSGVAFQTRTQKDFMPSQLTSSWLAANPDFDIRTDLTQALIDEQRTYSDKLALQNKELNSTTDGQPYKIETNPTSKTYGQSNAYGLMPVIDQLDYCIPGPHPGWEQDSRTTLGNVVIPLEQQQKTGTAGTVAKSVVSAGLNFVPIVGSFLSSMFGGLFGDSEAKDASYRTRLTYANEFERLTGYHLRTRDDMIAPTDVWDVNMSSADGLMQTLNTILNRYIDIVNKTYFSSPDYLPPVANEAATDFNQLVGYAQMIKDNEDKVLSLKTTVSILGDIKTAVDALNIEYKNEKGQFKATLDPSDSDFDASKTEENYESELKTQINAFGRLSAEMVNGDDIANADSIYKQIIDKRDYIYKNLLKGPYGCEAWLANQNNIINFPSAGPGVKETDWNAHNVNSVKRMTYPSPILYDYNDLTAKIAGKPQIIPDPLTDCTVTNPPESCSNKMPDTIPATSTKPAYVPYVLGPGFLDFIYFNRESGCDNNNHTGVERLKISDLADTQCNQTLGSQYVSLGQFENSIGIY